MGPPSARFAHEKPVAEGEGVRLVAINVHQMPHHGMLVVVERGMELGE